jgi:hypothetical protein
MKRPFVPFLASIVLVFLCGIAAAHPPSSLEAALQPDGKLRILVSHTVNDPVKHFINRVVVSSGGKVIAEERFNQQADRTGSSSRSRRVISQRDKPCWSRRIATFSEA